MCDIRSFRVDEHALATYFAGQAGSLSGPEFPNDDELGRVSQKRPHEALEMKCSANVYTPSRKPYSGLPDLT
jgi:hypothetical protein